MIDYFRWADETYKTERDKNRLIAIGKAKAQLKAIEKSRININYMLEQAQEGNFTALVETFVSVEVAEKYE